jgi:hypothetical protein
VIGIPDPGNLGDESFEQEPSAFRTAMLQHGIHRIEPFAGFLRVVVFRQAGVPTGQHVIESDVHSSLRWENRRVGRIMSPRGCGSTAAV